MDTRQTQMQTIKEIALKVMRQTVVESIMGVQPMPPGAGSIFQLRSSFRPPKAQTPKYNFSRHKWYEATLQGNVRDPNWLQARNWCAENFGSHPKHRDAWCRWYCTGRLYRFRDEEDYLLFLMRWGNDVIKE